VLTANRATKGGREEREAACPQRTIQDVVVTEVVPKRDIVTLRLVPARGEETTVRIDPERSVGAVYLPREPRVVVSDARERHRCAERRPKGQVEIRDIVGFDLSDGPVCVEPRGNRRFQCGDHFRHVSEPPEKRVHDVRPDRPKKSTAVGLT